VARDARGSGPPALRPGLGHRALVVSERGGLRAPSARSPTAGELVDERGVARLEMPMEPRAVPGDGSASGASATRAVRAVVVDRPGAGRGRCRLSWALRMTDACDRLAKPDQAPPTSRSTVIGRARPGGPAAQWGPPCLATTHGTG
jgi:hypothetical protein